jgi:hypothetical protein
LTSFSDFTIGGDNNDGPLPVELNNLTGRSINQAIQLRWTTQSETNNAGFTVLRDGLEIASYTTYNELRGKGTTTSASNYSFNDQTVDAGKTYTYTLRSFDLNGTIHNYPLVKATVTALEGGSLNNAPKEYALKQNYPNPFNPTTNIKYELPSAGLVTIKVYDILGRVVTTLINENKNAGSYIAVFDASRFSSGIYYYTISAGKYSKTMKLTLLK